MLKKYYHKQLSEHIPLAYPLAFCSKGQEVMIATINGCPKAKIRLESMGLIPGEKIMVINGRNNGPFIVKIKNSQLALGRGVLHKIMVR